MKKLYLLLFLSVSAFYTYAQVGNLDTTFGTHGIEKTKFISKGTLIDDKGESYRIEINNDNYNPTIRVDKYTSNGTIDLSFGTDGITAAATMKFFSAVLQDNGKIVVTGTVGFPYFIHDQVRIVRFNTDGSTDFTYTSPSIGTYYTFPTKLVKQGDDLVLIGYIASAAVSTNADVIFTFNTTGVNKISIGNLRNSSYSSGFGYNLSAYSASKSVAVQGDTVVVEGLELVTDTTFPYQSITASYLSKFINGYADTTFGNKGRLAATLAPGKYNHMFLAPDGKLLLVNSIIDTISGKSNFWIARYNANGSPDLTFNGNNVVTTEFGADAIAYALTFEDDKIIVGGLMSDKITRDTAFAIARYNNNGTLDSSFSDDGKQTLGASGFSYNLEKIKIADNELLASGTITSGAGETFKAVAAYKLKQKVSLVCPSDKIVTTDKGLCTSLVNNIDPVITPSASNPIIAYTFTGATSKTSNGSASGSTFSKGETKVTYLIKNEPGKNCFFTIKTEDKEAPEITKASVDRDTIFAHDHQMINVEIYYGITDNCTSIEPVITVTSNEAQSGTDKDDVADDYKIIDAHHIQLRAERAEGGEGRLYTITITATDAEGNKNEQHLKVVVPHDNLGKGIINGLLVKARSNPTRDFFTLIIESKTIEPVSLKVIDVFGRIIDAKANISPNSLLQIGNHYRAGVYFAEIKQGSNKQAVTLVKY